MTENIDHIGIAVSSLESSLDIYCKALGIEHIHTETLKDQNVKAALLSTGNTNIELLEATSSDSPIEKFIRKKGQGVHHIAFRVDSIEKALNNLKAKGFRLIDETPRKGAGNSKIAFIHPKSTDGVLIELCEKQEHKSEHI